MVRMDELMVGLVNSGKRGCNLSESVRVTLGFIYIFTFFSDVA